MGNFRSYLSGFGERVLMNTLEGIALAALRNKPLDETHSPYKRDTAIGPGPNRQSKQEQKHWECSAVPPVSATPAQRKRAEDESRYTQFCTYVGPPGHGIRPGRVKVVSVSAELKRIRNKQYDGWLTSSGMEVPRNNPNRFSPAYRYRPSQVPSVQAKAARYAEQARKAAEAARKAAEVAKKAPPAKKAAASKKAATAKKAAAVATKKATVAKKAAKVAKAATK